jgi:GntR family transcriptional regulator/MocR family aminotransferase
VDLHIPLAPRSRDLRARLERELRDAIRAGRLREGAVLPSSRALARDLGISRGVVVEAYAQLAAEGYLAARQGAATRVAARSVVTAERQVANRARPIRYDLRPGMPDLSAFPRRAWLSAVVRASNRVADHRLGYGDPRGAPELRAALSGYLGRVRGTFAEPDQVVVSNGLRDGLALLWRTLRDRGVRRVAIEDPGWQGQRETLDDSPLTAVPVPVDRDGLVIDALEEADVQAAIVTPAHQFPTGVVLTPERRAALIGWARRRQGVIIEDDYDAQYRYDREPVGTIQGLAPDITVHGGSTSKLLAPALRLGWLIVPPDLAQPTAERRECTDNAPPLLDQLALADFVDSGQLDRHLRRMRRRYRTKRELLLRAVARELPQAVPEEPAAGLHVVVRLPSGSDERSMLDAAVTQGIALEGLGQPEPTLLLGYGNLPEPSIEPAVAALAKLHQA